MATKCVIPGCPNTAVYFHLWQPHPFSGVIPIRLCAWDQMLANCNMQDPLAIMMIEREKND